MHTVKESFTLGQSKNFYVPGRFFRLMDSTAPATILFYRNGSLVGSAYDIGAGFAWEGANKTDKLFDSVSVTSSAAQSIQFAVSNEPVSYDRSAGSVDVNGDVSVVPKRALISTIGSGAVATINTTSTFVLNANPLRRYLFLQNVGTTTIFFRLAATVEPTINGGIMLNPGDSFTMDSVVLTGLAGHTSNVKAISSAAGGLLFYMEGQ